MSWESLGILLVTILGIILFLWASNSYNAVLGWAGVFLIVAAVVAYLVREIYAALRKRGS